MGDFGNTAWGPEILNAYISHSNHLAENLDYFHVIVSMKLLASTVIAFTFGPEEVGLRGETLETARGQLSIYQQLYERVRGITGLTLPELEAILEERSGGTSGN